MKSKTRPRNYKRYVPPLKRTASSTDTAIIQPEKNITHLFPTKQHQRLFEEGIAMLEKLAAEAKSNRQLQQL